MKIAYGIPVYWPAVNGASTFAHKWAEGISNDFEVKVITQSKENCHDWLYTPTLDSKGSFEYEDGNVKVSLIGVNRLEKFLLWPAVNFYYSYNNFSSRILYYIFKKKIFPKLKDFDIIHNYLLDMDYFNSLFYDYARYNNIPYVVTPFTHQVHWQDKISNVRFNLIKNADTIIVLTYVEKDWLSKKGVDSNKIHVANGGPLISLNYNAEGFKKKYNIDGNMVLFIANKRKYKGFHHILGSMKYVWSKHPNTYFVFIGLSTPEFAELFNQYKDKRVIDIGIVGLESEEKASALAACDIFCMPSIAESFGLVFTEAWFMEKPVIGGDCLSTREIIDDGKNGFIVGQNPESIAKKLILLLDDEELRKQMGNTGRRKVLKDYTWEIAVSKLKRIYSELLNKNA